MSEPVDPRAVALLRRERVSGVAPRGARDRVSRRLASVVPAFAAGASVSHRPDGLPTGAPSGAAQSGLAHTGFSAMRAIVISLVVGGAAGASLEATLASPHPPVVVYVDRPIPIPMATTEAPAPPVAPAAAETPSPPPPLPVAATSAATSATAARAPKAQLDAERALLDGARSALSRGDTEAALGDLARHARLYSQPILGEERDALTIEALVRAGRYDEARARADAFRHAAPGSIFLSVVEASVRSIP